MLDTVPVDTGSTTALIVMAVAVSVQAIVMIAALIALVVAARRLEAVAGEQYARLKADVDDAVAPIRHAAQAVEHVSMRASTAMDRAGHTAGILKTFLAAPRTALVFGAASMASAVLKRWPRKQPGPPVVPVSHSRIVH